MGKHPTYEGIVILQNVRSCLLSDGVVFQKTTIFTFMSVGIYLPFSLRKSYMLKFFISCSM